MIRLRGKKIDVSGLGQPEPSQEKTLAGLLQRRLSKRQFLKGLTAGAGATGAAGSQAVGAAAPHLWKLLAAGAGVVGVAGAAQLGAPPRRAEATYTPGSPYDTVDKHLLVQGPDGYDVAGERAIVYLGNTNYGLSAENGFGLRLGVYKSGGGGTLGPNSTDALSIREATGNVGVGTGSPGGRLDVSGGYLALDNGDNGTPRGIRFRNTTDTTTPSGGGLYQANNNNVYLQAGNANMINFRKNDSYSLLGRFDDRDGSTLVMPLGGRIRPWNGDAAQALHIATYGGVNYVTFDSLNQRLGIGTTTPSALLNLRGNLTQQLQGTVTVDSLDPTVVVGSGTSFLTELAVGDAIKIGSQTFTVASITSNTGLTLSSPYSGSPPSGIAAYRDQVLLAIDSGSGVNKVTVTRSGKVGIGKTPSQQLDVAGNVAVDYDLYANVLYANELNVDVIQARWGSLIQVLTPSTAAIGVQIQSGNSSQVPLIVKGASGQTGDLMEWQNFAGDTVVKVTKDGDINIPNGGKIGVGVANPLAMLSVKGSLSLALTGTVTVATGSAGVSGSGTAFMSELAVGDGIKIGSEVFTVSAITSDAALTLSSPYQGAGGSLLTAYRDPALLTIDNGLGVNKVTVARNGRLGIGVTNPGHKLSVASGVLGQNVGNTVPWMELSGDDGNARYLRFVHKRYAAGSNHMSAEVRIQEVIDTSNRAFVAFRSDSMGSNLVLGTDGGDRLFMDTYGNAGIGATPGSTRPGTTFKLEVNGDVNLPAGKSYMVNGVPIQGGSSLWTLAGSGPDIYRNSGNVGIATTNPTEKLEVGGNIKLSGTVSVGSTLAIDASGVAQKSLYAP